MIADQSLTQVQTQQCYNQINVERNNSSLKADKKVQIGTLDIDNVKHPIYKGINLIGRHPRCHIVIPHLTVSKRHAEIEADDKETIFIMDLQSSNGTMINQKLLKPDKSYQLVPKNTLSFGEVSAILNCNDDDKNFVVPETPCQNNLKQSSSSSINTSKDPKNQSKSDGPVCRSVPSPLGNTSNVKLKKKVEPDEAITRRHSDSVIKRKSVNNKSIHSDEDIFDSSIRNDSKSSSVEDSVIFDVTTQKFHEPSAQNDPKSSSVEDISIFDVTTQNYINDEEDVSAAKKTACKKVETKDSPNSSEVGTSLKGLFGEASTSGCTEINDKSSENNKMSLVEEKVDEEKEDEDIIPESDDEPLNEEEDDLFEDLPKFRIPNTLSNPASPTSEVSNSSDDLPAQNLTPRTLKFKEVMKSLRTSKIFNQVDDGLDDITMIGSRLLNVKSAYDNIVDPVSGERCNSPTETGSNRKSPKKVDSKSQPARRGTGKKKNLETTMSSKMSPLTIEKINQSSKPGVKVEDLRIVLQHLDESPKSSQEIKLSQDKMDIVTTEVSNEVAELPSTKRAARKSSTKLVDFTTNSNVEVKPTEAETKNGNKSRRKRNVEEREEIATKNEVQNKKMKVEKTLKVEDQKTSPVLNRRSSRRKNLDVSLNQSIDRSLSDINKSPLNITIQSSRRSKLEVLFTGVDPANWKKCLTKLGVLEATNIATCSVLLTDKVRRTVKFLCALGRGIPIISVKWIEDSFKAGECLSFDDYILKDIEAEKKFGFNLRKSLESANTKKLFEELTILLTPKIVAPPIGDLKEIIKTAGGSALINCPRRWPKNVVIVTTENDIENAKKFAAKSPKDITIHSTELILSGILRQKIDLQSFLMNRS